jgi:hydrogenase maturation protease
MRVLVACIGNIFHGDDAFGCEVAKLLAQRPALPDVRVVDFGIRGLDLTYALLDAPELTIMVDTVSRGGDPGTVYTIEPRLDAVAQAGLNPHSLDPVRALQAAKAMGAHLQRIVLVGCEPSDLGGEEGRLGLTPPVSHAVPKAAAIVERLAAERQLTSFWS